MSTKENKTQVKEEVKMSPREVNKQKNRKARKQENASVDGVTYLKEGVTGAMRRTAILDTNQAIKENIASYSEVFNFIFKNEVGFIAQLSISKTQFKKQVTPRMVKNQLTDFQLELAINSLNNEDRGYIKHSHYFIMNAMEKALKSADVNPLAVELFDCLDNNDKIVDEKTFKAVSLKVMKARAKAKKLAEAKKAKAEA